MRRGYKILDVFLVNLLAGGEGPYGFLDKKLADSARKD